MCVLLKNSSYHSSSCIDSSSLSIMFSSLCVPNTPYKSDSSLLEKIRLNLFASKNSSLPTLEYAGSLGGGKIGSTAMRMAFSSIEGMILASKGQESSRQGLVLTSISQV